LGSSVFVSEDAEAPEYLKQSVGFGQPCGCALAARFVHQVLEHQNAARLEQLRGLLRERFGFAAHWEKRDLAGYAPVVGHNGPKMKQSAESEMEAPESSGPTRLDENLFPVIPPGYPPKGIVTFRNGDTLFNTGARHASMDILAVELSRYLKQPHRRRDGASCEVRFRPILDARFVCCCAYCRRWVGGALTADGGLAAIGTSLPTLQQALQKLGLKLERRKLATDVLVVDHTDKAPTEN
jgi:uncharacterized protein (TIGR03435 family)